MFHMFGATLFRRLPWALVQETENKVLTSMAGNGGDRQRIQQEIARHKERIENLTQELRTTIRSKEERIKALENGKKAQEESIKALENKNKALQEEINDLKNKNKSLEKRLQEMNEQIVKLVQDKNDNKAREDKEKSVLIITQIGTAIQRNICKYVLGEHFIENDFYKVKDLEIYIADLKEPTEQEIATKRWSELKGKDIWDQRLVNSLKNLNQKRIGIAHPELTSETIQQAMVCLEKAKYLNEGMLINIRKLKKNWETSESLLQKPDPMESANEKQVRGAEGVEKGNNLKQPTYANKISGNSHSVVTARAPGVAGRPVLNGM